MSETWATPRGDKSSMVSVKKKSPEYASGRERRYGYGLSCLGAYRVPHRTGCHYAEFLRGSGFACHITPCVSDKVMQEKFLNFVLTMFRETP